MGSGVSKSIRTGMTNRLASVRGLVRLFLALLLILVFSAVKCGSLIEGEESDSTAAASGGGSSGSSSSCTQSITINYATGGGVQSISSGASDEAAQSFTVSQNTKISKIDLKLSVPAGTSGATVDLYQGGADPTAGTLLASSTVTVAGTYNDYQSFAFSDISITTGQTYYIAVRHSSGMAFAIYFDSPSATYNNGTMWTRNTPTWNQQINYDAVFRVTTCD